MKNGKQAVVIISGGMDSTTLLYDIVSQGYDVKALSFNYGQRHKKELKYAAQTCEKLHVPHQIVDLSSINPLIQGSALTSSDIDVPEGHYADENMKITVVPNRNMIMLSIAIGYAVSIKAQKVFYGVHRGDHQVYPDCRKVFVNAMQTAAQLCDFHGIELEAPYLDIDKGDIAILGKKLDVDYSLAWTCYKGGDKACGKCGSCVERLEAFAKARMKDPLLYAEVPELKVQSKLA